MSSNECPRCGHAIPNDAAPGAYPGALSRWDNLTEICSQCGSEEALIQLARGSIAPDGPNPWLRAPLPLQVSDHQADESTDIS